MTDLLVGIKCKLWVDDVFFYADTEDELLDTLDEILARLESVGLFAAAHKCTFFSREIVWCGKVYSQGRVSHDPVRLQGLSDMRRPETAAELMQFLQAMNWLRTSLPRMAEVVAPRGNRRIPLHSEVHGSPHQTEGNILHRQEERHAEHPYQVHPRSCNSSQTSGTTSICVLTMEESTLQAASATTARQRETIHSTVFSTAKRNFGKRRSYHHGWIYDSLFAQ